MARNASVDQFAHFSLAMAVMIPMLTSFMLMPCNWLLVEATYEPESKLRRHLRGAVLMGIIAGLVGGAIAGAVSLAIGVRDVDFVLALMLLLPGQLAASVLRYEGYRRSKPLHAVAVSGSILALFGLGLLLLQVMPETTWTAPIWAFVVAHWLVLAVSLVRSRWYPSLSAMVDFARLGRDSWKSVGADMIGVNARQLAVPYVAAAFGGLPAAAGIRGAQALAGLPLQIPQGLLPQFQAKMARIYAATNTVSRPILREWTVIQCALLLPCVVDLPVRARVAGGVLPRGHVGGRRPGAALDPARRAGHAADAHQGDAGPRHR